MTDSNQPNTIANAEQLVAARARVASLAELLGHDELCVLEHVAQGLARGRSQYGELIVSTDPRDFTAEAAAEIRDALVYFGAQLLRLHRRDSRHTTKGT